MSILPLPASSFQVKTEPDNLGVRSYNLNFSYLIFERVHVHPFEAFHIVSFESLVKSMMSFANIEQEILNQSFQKMF